MIRPAQQPRPLPASGFYFGGGNPAMRAAELPEMCSLQVQELFPDIPDPIYHEGGDLTPVRDVTERALAAVDMSCIERGDTVNLLCSEHGFNVVGGHAYAEVLRIIRREVTERTGARVRLGMGCAGNKGEPLEIIPQFGLDEEFEGHTFGFGPNDRGVPIETEIGTIYGVRKAFNAKKIIHAHYDDTRELHFHRVNGRLLKSFTMSYARIETRSAFHNNFPTRSANIIPRAIYESPFIRERWAFATAMSTTPAGLRTVDADNDLLALDRRIAIELLRNYGKMIELFRSIDECFTIHDDTRWLFYQHAGGLCSCTLFEATHEFLDLDNPPTKAADFYDRRIVKDPVKGLVLNAGWRFIPCASLMIAADPGTFMELSMMTETIPGQEILQGAGLADAVEMAKKKTGTDKAIIFDGSWGHINMTRSMAEYLMEQAPRISRDVDERLLPKWARQRNLSLSAPAG